SSLLCLLDRAIPSLPGYNGFGGPSKCNPSPNKTMQLQNVRDFLFSEHPRRHRSIPRNQSLETRVSLCSPIRVWLQFPRAEDKIRENDEQREVMVKKLAVLYVLLGGFCLLFAGKAWDENPYTEWSRKQALKVLTKSPWASSQVISQMRSTFGSGPLGSGSATGNSTQTTRTPGISPSSEARNGETQTSREYKVRFQSAAPIRMALARLSLLKGSVSQEDAQQFVQNAPGQGEIVVMLALGYGQDRSELDNVTTELLKNETYLILKKSKKRIYLKRYLTPAEAGGIEAIFLFPRQEDGHDLITLEEKEVRFISRLNPQTRINRKFKLKDMVFNGKLEI
ncbi:MAG: hypothetical protein ACE5JX_23005, partial [Acidobacteriota bacterium]